MRQYMLVRRMMRLDMRHRRGITVPSRADMRHTQQRRRTTARELAPSRSPVHARERGMRRLVSVSVLAFAAGLFCACSGLACAKSHTDNSVLQPDDLSTDGDPPFDPTEIVDALSFSDYLTLDRSSLQHFLTNNPYNGSSFLSTYQSNGVLAVDAVVSAAQNYRINPLVFLVRAEMEQGLIGESAYPFPPSRVEYVFGCGCDSTGACDPKMAGFDVQVTCLAQQLHQSLEEI